MRERAEPTRRRYLQAVAALTPPLTAGLAGCSSSVESNPDPQVVNSEVEPPLEEILEGEVSVAVLIHNVGGAGTIEVTADAIDVHDERVKRADIEREMDGDEQTEFTIEMSVPVTADRIVASATAVTGGE